MRYADTQLVRPQHEHGCDYGYGRRSVLVTTGKGEKLRQLLHIAGAKHWSGSGCDRHYSKAEIVVYPVDKDGSCKQKTLAEGRMSPSRWEEIAPEIYKHIGAQFDLRLIDLKHTLLLDEPGEVDGPPLREPGPKKEHPWIASDRIFKIFHDAEDFNKLALASFPIVKQGGGKITYQLSNGREVEKRTKEAIEEGCGGTFEEAIAGYLRDYQTRVAGAKERLERAAHSFVYHDDNLTEARQRIEAMTKKEKEE